MAITYRSSSLQTSELLALYGGARDPCTSRESVEDQKAYELVPERGSEGAAGIPRSLSLDDYSMDREEADHGFQQVYFSNQEYYWRLEELKKTHLRNMAELERMYIGRSKVPNQPNGGNAGLEGDEVGSPRVKLESARSMPVRTLQQIYSDEELHFNDTSSVSDQSEDDRGNNHTKLEQVDKLTTFNKPNHFGRDIRANLAGTAINQKPSKSQIKVACHKGQRKLARQTQGRVGAHSPRVTVTKPFQMTLREEEKKRIKVRTRSEVELENCLLRLELDELRECGRKFRATPAPAHTQRPLYEMVSHPSRQLLGHCSSFSCNSSKGNRGGGTHGNGVARPFSFLERERKKREQKIVAELGNLAPKEERRVFKARPMPRFVHSSTQRQQWKEQLIKTQNPSPRSLIHNTLLGEESSKERVDTVGDKHTTLDPKLKFCSYQEMPPQYNSYWRSQRRPSIKKAAEPLKQRDLPLGMELEMKRVKELEWSYIDPIRSAGMNVSIGMNKDSLLVNKSDYISV